MRMLRTLAFADDLMLLVASEDNMQEVQNNMGSKFQREEKGDGFKEFILPMK